MLRWPWLVFPALGALVVACGGGATTPTNCIESADCTAVGAGYGCYQGLCRAIEEIPDAASSTTEAGVSDARVVDATPSSDASEPDASVDASESPDADGVDAARDADTSDGGLLDAQASDAGGERVTCAGALCGAGQRCLVNSCDRVLDVAMTATASCAYLESGRIACWGMAMGGERGDGTGLGATEPTLVTPPSNDPFAATLEADVRAGRRIITATEELMCALTAGGRVACWGTGDHGLLGETGLLRSDEPVIVQSPLAGRRFVHLASGLSHVCVLDSAGSAACWGANYTGQLSRDTSVGDFSRTLVPAGSSLRTVSAGYSGTCTVSVTGVVHCRGFNPNGQLGSLDPQVRELDVPLPGPALDVVLSEANGCAILEQERRLVCWGDNSWGVVGPCCESGTLLAPTATSLTGVTSAWLPTAALCVATDDGAVRCRGASPDGRAGGVVFGMGAPLTVMRDPSGAPLDGTFRLRGDPRHACALDETGPRCWGTDDAGQLGASAWSVTAPTPRDVRGVLDLAVTRGGVAVRTSEGVFVGGLDRDGRYLYTRRGYTTPTSAIDTPLGIDPATRVVFGEGTGFAMPVQGGLVGWGRAYDGSLGLNMPPYRVETPTTINTPAGGTPRDVSAGPTHTCVVDGVGRVYCFGTSETRAHGSSTRQLFTTAASVLDTMGASITARRVWVGRRVSCAMADDGRAWCWGARALLGSTQTADSERARLLSIGVSDMAVGEDHVCAIVRATSQVHCWGDDERGALGTTGGTASTTPVRVSNDTATAVVAAAGRTCANFAGRVRCWGRNELGQLGDGMPSEFAFTPREVNGIGDVTALAISGEASCVVSGSERTLTCWGADYAGGAGAGRQLIVTRATRPAGL